MSLPPIISNLPFLKLFRSNDPADKVAGSKKVQKADKATQQSGDIVQISNSARVRLSATGSKDAKQARETSLETKEQLQQEQVSLGLSPDFS